MPVCFVSARNGAGVAELLDVLVKLLPNPTEGNPPLFSRARARPRRSSAPSPIPKKHVLAHVFKVVIDPFVGKLGVFRVHQGTVTRDTQLFVGDGRKPFKVGHLFMLQGEQERRDRPRGARATSPRSPRSTRSSSTACCTIRTTRTTSTCGRSSSRRRCTGVAITPKKRGDEQRISDVLHRIDRRGPHARRSSTTRTRNETVLRALGDLHLRSVLERMASQFKLEVDTRPPRIPYRETITGKAEGHHRHKKQTGGAGQFGEVSLRVEPLPRGAGFEFVDATKGGVIPHQFMPAVQKGVEQVLATGRGRRLPAAGRARHRLRRQAPPGRLEGSRVRHRGPQGVPRRDREGAADRARADRQRRDHLPRGEHRRHRRRPVVAARPGDRHQGGRPGALAITGLAPLVELDGYAARLKSVTGGHGACTMALSHYEAAPPTLQQQLVAEFEKKRKHEED